MDWYQVKTWLAIALGLSMDALHVHAGVIAQLLVAALLRRSLASPWPWLAVFVAEIGNEWFDLAYEIWPTREQQYAEAVRDVWNTMLLPTLLFLLARYAPRVLGGAGEATRKAPATADRA